MVEFLIQKGADVHTRDLHDRTTLVIAAYAGNVNVLRLLLQHGVDLFHRNKHGFDDLGNRRQFKPEVIKTLEEYENCKRTGERSVGGTGGPAVPEISCSGTTAAPPMGAPVQTGAGVLPEAGAQQEEECDSVSDLDLTSLKVGPNWACLLLSSFPSASDTGLECQYLFGQNRPLRSSSPAAQLALPSPELNHVP
ncbi:ankyrin repeat domain-containing protein 35-like [Columba livia]|uniref:ankyrin repeat domain-containing protein 35-like n=1 Tax=Columba livia TaxID=8932 RepID=UPI0031BAEB75